MMKNIYSMVVLMAAVVSGQGNWPHWENVGPGGGGWIQSILASRTDAKELFVGCDVGGFYHSLDNGASYRTYNTGLDCYYIETIAQHPVNSDVLFLGSPGGLYKSTDHGRSWQLKRNGLPPIERYSWSCPIGCIVFSPFDANTVYAVNGSPREGRGKLGRIYKSTDCGETWRQVSEDGQLPGKCNPISMVADPLQKGRLVLSTSKGVYASEDDGHTWTASNTGLPSHLRCRRLAMAPSNPRVLYLSLLANSGEEPWQGGIYRSDDGGRSWQPRNQGIPTYSGKTGQTWMLTCNVDCLLVHPKDENTVYAGGSAWVNATVYKTTDGGLQWRRIMDESNYQRGWINFWGPSVYCFTMSPVDPERLYFGTSGHVFTTPDGGNTWKTAYYKDAGDGRTASCGLEVTCLHCVVPHPTIKDKIYFGYFDIGLMRSDDGGKTMRRMMKGIPHSHDNSCFKLVFDGEARPQCAWGMFGSWGGNRLRLLARTVDGGENWTPLSEQLGDEAVQLLLAERTPVAAGGQFVLYVTQLSRGILRSTDDGETWQDFNQGLPGKNIVSLAVDEKTSRKYCVLSGSKTENVRLYIHDGDVWRLGNDALPIAELKSFAVGKNNCLFIAAREGQVNGKYQAGGLYRSLDGGKTWKHLYNNHFGSGLALDPFKEGRLAASFVDHPFHDQCVGAGVFLSEDNGETWKSLNSNTLHNRNGSTMVFDPIVPGRLWVGTGGNSVFVTNLN